MMNYMLITNDPVLAAHADGCGVSRIFIDLETIGKQVRQGHLDTLISSHNVEDIPKVKRALTDADILVRVNPLHDNTQDEVNRVIEQGADVLMLPMFQNSKELNTFMAIVDGRAPVVPLFETVGAVADIEEIVSRDDIHEVYIGLNDLHLDMGLRFMFEPLASGLIDTLAATTRKAGVRFGFGGIARVGEGIIPGEMVLGEHLRLGSSRVILSRTFHKKSEDPKKFTSKLDLQVELDNLSLAEKTLSKRTEQEKRNDFSTMQSVVEGYINQHV
jgi:2-keto-3-deoxy-L-rhamnonate aldolase RhmA